MTGGAAVARSLVANGVDTVFGLPGVQCDHVFDGLYHEREKLRVITSRHEQGAAYMAFGYAQSTGRLSPYVVVPGPGLLNTATPLCIAHSCNAPVLAITSQIATRYTGLGLGVLHEIPNTAQIFSSFSKYQGFADAPARVPTVVNECIRRANSGRKGAVLLEVAEDITAEKAEISIPEAAVIEPAPQPDPEMVAKASAILGAAKNPLIYVGGGAVDAGEALQALAEALQAPVVMTRHGRGILTDRHPLAQTQLGGHVLWRKTDVVLVVGSRFLDAENWGTDSDMKIIRIDMDAVQATRPVIPDIRLIGDAASILRSVFNALPSRNRKRTPRVEELRLVRELTLEKFAELQPQKAYSDAIREALPDDAITICDVTQLAFYMRLGFPLYKPRTQIFSGYQDSLGFGFATALGAKVAYPEKPVVCITGDGGFMFTMPEIATAVKYNIPLVTVLFNDSAFGNVLRIQKMQYGGRYIGSKLTNPDFMKLAESFGIAGFRANSPEELRKKLEVALACGAPALIEVPVGPMPAWQPFIPRSRARS
jgi:acetolactate synthase-1/2/3 large subunit